jgi:GNAT superfamily N-acetyltransferase
MRPTARPYEPADRRWVEGLLEQMGSSRVARLGEVIEPADLPGLIAERDGERLGLLTWIVDDDQLEVLSLHCRVENVGAGSVLLQAAAELAAGRGCRRLWLLTTNDNLHALGFYQRRGLRLRPARRSGGPGPGPQAGAPRGQPGERDPVARPPRAGAAAPGSGRRCGGINAWPVKRPGGGGMGSDHTPADDIVYDLVSIQYHALKAGQTYATYIEDAEGHDDVQDFIRQIKEEDAGRAIRCHELLTQLTKGGGIG